MSADPTTNGELQHAPVPASGPVRVLEPRQRLLPALPMSGTALVTGGFVIGAIALAMRAVRLRRGRRGAGRARSVVASRSFLVDVHLLGR